MLFTANKISKFGEQFKRFYKVANEKKTGTFAEAIFKLLATKR